jgi:hypothetical protein
LRILEFPLGLPGPLLSCAKGAFATLGFGRRVPAFAVAPCCLDLRAPLGGLSPALHGNVARGVLASGLALTRVAGRRGWLSHGSEAGEQLGPARLRELLEDTLL